jgi:UDP-glucuronate 4-epimerase
VTSAILVTGAAGFIGSHLTQALLRRRDTVVGLDNLNNYYDPARKRANLKEIRAGEGADGFHFVEGDIRDVETINSVFERYDFRSIAHLAAMAGVRASINDPQLYYDVNLSGTLNILNAVRDRGAPNVVFASTSSVYGATEVVPFIETDNADRPLAPYPGSKRAAEMLGFSYHHLYDLNFTAMRFFTVYGPRGRPDMMAHKVLNNIFFGEEVPLYNGGQMHRDWTYVDDIVAGVTAGLDRPLAYEIINLGRGEPVLLADFVNLTQQLAGRAADLTTEPMMTADISYTYADITKARKLLGYDPGVSVEEGVRRFWDWYRIRIAPARPVEEPRQVRHF